MSHDHPADYTPDDETVEEAEQRLREAGEPYVLATVVRREAPISAAVGDRAVVTTEGIQAGWIGGVGCAQAAVTREARHVLDSGEPKLVGLAPDPETIARPGLEAFTLTCHSGGTLEVFLDPVRTAPRLLVVGGSAIAKAVVGHATDLGFLVTVVDPAGGAYPDADAVLATTDYREIVEAVGGAEAVVVATVGEFDARGVAAALELDAGWIGLVASRRRAEEVFERTADVLGVDVDAVRERVESPAGLDIHAETPPEIALSILAELVSERDSLRAGVGRAAPAAGEAAHAGHGAHEHGPRDSAEPAGAGQTAVDPVCGMTIDVRDAAATVEYDGVTYYFCSRGCADAFAERPEEHLGTA